MMAMHILSEGAWTQATVAARAHSLNRALNQLFAISLLAAAFSISHGSPGQRNLIVEVGPAAYQHWTAVPCNATGNVSYADCYQPSAPGGSADYTWGSPEISYPKDGGPWGLHLSGPYPDGRTYLLSWYTGAAVVGPNLTQPDTSRLKATVAVTKDIPGAAAASKSFTGPVITYLRPYNNASLTNYTYLSPYIHHVVLRGLSPNTTYRYRVSDRSGQQLYGDWAFRTLPTGGSSYPLRIGLMGDVGQTLNSTDTRDHMLSSRPQVIVFVGDNSYADKYGPADPDALVGGGSNQNRWDSYAWLWQPLYSTVPVLNCVGNHEIEEDSIAAAINYTTTSFAYPSNFPFQTYAARHPVPGTTSGFGSITPALYYSTRVGGVAAVLTLNNYVPFHPGSPQHSWALAEFAKVDRKKTPWLIVQTHAAPYHTYTSHYKDMDCFLSIWEDIFYQYGVDFVVSGHVHAYERTHPVYRYGLDTCGPVYLAVGDGGNVEGLARTFVDSLDPATNKTYCEGLTTAGVDPVTIFNTNPSGWGPTYQRQAQPPNCTSLTFQPPSGVKGGPPLVPLNPGAPDPNTGVLGFCQSSQPVWSAARDPSFGHAVLELRSADVAHFQWFKNSGGEKVPADDVVFERLSSCPNRAPPPPPGSPARRSRRSLR